MRQKFACVMFLCFLTPGLKVACGAIGIGEITSIPTAPAIADAYFRRDGVRRYSLPLSETPYERKG